MAFTHNNKRWWRELSSNEEFFELTGLDEPDQKDFRKIIGDSLSARILAYCDRELRNWVQLRSRPTADDDVVNVWLHMHARLAKDKTATTVAALDVHYLAVMKDYSAMQATEAEADSWSLNDLESKSNAFCAAEKRTAAGQFPSKLVLNKLLRQFHDYTSAPNMWMGPYTTIIGPSGIGKSFSVKQLAVRHGLYVAYTNLAPSKSMCYPRPVALGQVPLVTGSSREQLTEQWKQYLAFQLRLIETCKKQEVTPSGLFALLTSGKSSIVGQRRQLENTCKLAAATLTDADLEAMIDGCKSVLEQECENPEPCGSGASIASVQPTPPLVVCFDEARALLDSAESMSFRCLRQAAANFFGERPATPFFVVLLDTTSRISNFTPLLETDPSRKQGRKNVFPPLHQIDTWDVLAPENENCIDVDGSVDSVTRLFSHGRPLWASFLNTGETVGSVVELARQKMEGAGDASHVGLLTYRVNFYVTSRQLAETLVASFMRYLITISENCSTPLTSQPSEPVLAFAASRELQKPERRLQCISAWMDNLQMGACNLGDVGEMVAALVLLFSFDYVARPLTTLPHAVGLQAFLRAFLTPSHWTALHDGHMHLPEIKEVLEDGLVFFNHFVRASSSTPITEDALELAYRRGAALFLPAHFPGMDIAIPIRIRTTGTLAVLLVQVKNRHGDSATPGLRLKMAEDLDKATQKLGTSQLHSVIGLAMCLRCSSESSSIDIIQPAPLQQHSTKKRKSSVSSPSRPAVTAANKKAHLLAIICGLRGIYSCLEKPAASGSETETETAGEEESSALNERERDSMDRVCSFLEELLGKWPEFYKNEDVSSAYAQRLLDPFYATRKTA